MLYSLCPKMRGKKLSLLKYSRINYWLIISSLIIIADQTSKAWAARNLVFGKFYPIIPQVNLYLTHNKGIAFSLFAASSQTIHNILLITSCLIIVTLTVFEFRLKPKQHILRIAFALIIGGAIGNVVDKVCLGYVIDFIDFYIYNWHFATFNIADAAISIGAALLIIDSFYQKN